MPLNFAVYWVMQREINDHHGVWFATDYFVTDPEFVDELAVLREDPITFHATLGRVNEHASEIDLEITYSVHLVVTQLEQYN